MMESLANKAWLEKDGGVTVPLQGTCTIGRSSSNQVVLEDQKASRRHAFVHGQGADEWWLVDQGSSNGTYLNDRRVSLPTRLRNGDRIQIGDCVLVFRQPTAGHTEETHFSDHTVIDIKARPCWLLLADIASSSEMARTMAAEEVAHIVGQWLSACGVIIEASSGSINKYLGDGFFAYWPDTKNSPEAVLQCLRKLKKLQLDARPGFRLVLHHGKVTMGGTPTKGEESLSGPDVNFIFRMEKLAGSLRSDVMLSESAVKKLGLGTQVEPAGSHPLSGFPGTYPFFNWPELP